VRGFGAPEFDDEGRYLEIQLGKLRVVSLYLPSGSAGETRQASKFRFLDVFVPHLSGLLQSGAEYILCGDWNIAHKEIDLKNWRSNQKNSGFLPEERKWLDELFTTHNFVDAFRIVNSEPDQYTWWSNRGRAWDKNVGWRIDYQVVTPGLRDRIRRTEIFKAQRFSDHAPLIMDYDCRSLVTPAAIAASDCLDASDASSILRTHGNKRYAGSPKKNVNRKKSA
jgi:exodeoxyribonuclease-3